MTIKDITVIITTFKSDDIITACLDSIDKEIKVIVIENSRDESFKERIETMYQNVECIIPDENLGYSRGNNLGLKKVKTNYALVLNPDTIIKKDSIKNFLISAKNYDFTLMGPFNDQIKDFNNQRDLIEVSNLKGFAIFFDMSKFKDLSFFDENYFLYFEEIDLCKRVRNKNGKIYINPEINIKHIGASSVNDNFKEEIEINRNWHWMWSTFYYHKKFNGFFYSLLLISPKFFSALIKNIFYFLTFNTKKRIIYQSRLNGLISSILGKNSSKRPSLD